MVAVTTINLTVLATSFPYANELAALSFPNASDISFLSFSPAFSEIITPSTTARLISSQPYAAFHEAGVYNRGTNSIYIASNWDAYDNPINVTVLNLTDLSVSSTRFPGLTSPNGGCTYAPPDQLPSTPDSPATPPFALFADEGNFEQVSGLVQLDPATGVTTPLLTSFLGRNFSSVNDVRQHPVTGDIWFTDAQYGFLQDFRPRPDIPSQVYRFEPRTGRVAAVADGFVQANGLEFSPDLHTLYVTDTGAQLFDRNFSRPATVYAFDVIGGGGKYLRNRRTFAYADAGIPDGIHTDVCGNVWSSCGAGDGVHVWDRDGELIGKIIVPGGEDGGSNNFAFVPGGVVVFNRRKLWLVEGIGVQGREVARDFGV